MKFTEVLKELRAALGYTQQDIANILKTDRSTYAYYETGKTEPNIRSLRRISNLFSVTIDDMVNGRIRPTESIFSTREEINVENMLALRNLSQEERAIVLLYRACENKEKLLNIIRDFEDDSPQNEP